MKMQLIVGMMILSTAISFNAHAAVGAGKSVREVLVDYVKEVKKYAFEGKTSAADLNAQQSKKAQDKLMTDLKLSAAEKTSINSMIAGSSDKTAATNSLATILAAKNMAAGKSDESSVAINNGADAALKMMSNADLIGAKKSSSTLSKEEFTDTTTAMKKAVAMPEKYLTFETKELASYTKVMNKANELSTKTETFEDAFVQAIIEVQSAGKEKPITKEQAMEIVRKLKECV